MLKQRSAYNTTMLQLIVRYLCNSRPRGYNAFCALRCLHFAEQSNMVNNSVLSAYVMQEEKFIESRNTRKGMRMMW